MVKENKTHKCHESELHLCHFMSTKVRFVLPEAQVDTSF